MDEKLETAAAEHLCEVSQMSSRKSYGLKLQQWASLFLALERINNELKRL